MRKLLPVLVLAALSSFGSNQHAIADDAGVGGDAGTGGGDAGTGGDAGGEGETFEAFSYVICTPDTSWVDGWGTYDQINGAITEYLDASPDTSLPEICDTMALMVSENAPTEGDFAPEEEEVPCVEDIGGMSVLTMCQAQPDNRCLQQLNTYRSASWGFFSAAGGIAAVQLGTAGLATGPAILAFGGVTALAVARATARENMYLCCEDECRNRAPAPARCNAWVGAPPQCTRR